MQQYYLTTRESLAEAIRLAHRALELKRIPVILKHSLHA
jgi:hypothetical protein